jgi:hypothetical protein
MHSDAAGFYPPRQLPKRRKANFVIGSKPIDGAGNKVVLVELDPTEEVRVGDLLEGVDSRTNRRYAWQVSDVEPAYEHTEQHAEMLDQLRRRPDREIDDQTFTALCKSQAVCTLLGEIVGDSLSDTGYRPNKYTTTAFKAGDQVEAMMVHGWGDGAPFAMLRKGREVRQKHTVHFSTTQLVGKRFAIFAQTGGGKGTAMRHLVEWHTRQMGLTKVERPIGLMVDDFKMEYPFDTKNERNETVPGLVTKLGAVARDRLVILTTNPDRYSGQANRVREILHAQIPLDSLTLSTFADIAGLTTAQANLVQLLENSPRTTPASFFNDLFAVDEHGLPDRARWAHKYGRTFYSDKGRKKVESGGQIDSDEDVQQGLRERL